MKNKYWLLVVALCISSFSMNAQQWRRVLAENGVSMSSSYFVNTTTGWYVGSGGYVGKTDDGGKTITDLNTGIPFDLRAVFFVDADTGFVGGTDDMIFKTKDGGQTWLPIAVPVTLTGGTIYSIYFVNEFKGWVMSSTSKAGQVIYTTDGGANWDIVVDGTSGDLEEMTFYGDKAGIVVGGGAGKMDIYYTSSGNEWTKAALPSLPSTVTYTRTDLKGIYMCSSEIAYVVGWGSSVGAQPSIHLKTTDGGTTWTYLEQAEENRTYDNLSSVYFKDENNGVAVGGGGKGSVAVRTTDGGATWIPIDFPCGATLNKINGFENDLFVTGSSGEVFTSNDFGDTWELLSEAPSATLSTVCAASDNVIYVAGFNGLIFKSINGGIDWKAGFIVANKVAPNVQKIFFVDEETGYAAHSYGMVSKTTDGGLTWEAVIKDTTAATIVQYGLYFFDQNTGFSVGKAASNVDAIYKTTDGGSSWELKTGIAKANLRAVSFANTQTGVAVAEKLKIIYTADGGDNWQVANITNVPSDLSSKNLYDVAFINSTDAIAVGDNLILKTSDGGANWDYVAYEELAHKLNGVEYNNGKGWTVGYSSSTPKGIALLQTTDSGQTWLSEAIDYTVMDSLVSVNDITLSPSGTVFIVGNSSYIYTNALGPSAIDDNDAVPYSLKLNQNYPNPFNPSTLISYEINNSSNVELKVYNILGREVATLVNEVQVAGTHQIKFNPALKGLSSGVYFYQLKTGSLMQTKKMIYLK